MAEIGDIPMTSECFDHILNLTFYDILTQYKTVSIATDCIQIETKQSFNDCNTYRYDHVMYQNETREFQLASNITMLMRYISGHFICFVILSISLSVGTFKPVSCLSHEKVRIWEI